MIPLKQFLAQESKAYSVAVASVRDRIWRGEYPGLRYDRSNRRKILVQPAPWVPRFRVVRPRLTGRYLLKRALRRIMASEDFRLSQIEDGFAAMLGYSTFPDPAPSTMR